MSGTMTGSTRVSLPWMLIDYLCMTSSEGLGVCSKKGRTILRHRTQRQVMYAALNCGVGRTKLQRRIESVEEIKNIMINKMCCTYNPRHASCHFCRCISGPGKPAHREYPLWN